jgi:hypothetical protein
VHEDTVSLGQALRLHPELRRIFDLGRIGWVGQRLNIDGEPALIFRYNWPYHIDALWIFDRTRCLALRSVDDAPGMVGGTVWKFEGQLDEALDEVLRLPKPETDGAPSLVQASSGLLWTPS